MMETLSFDNSYARLPDVFFSRVKPAVVPSPRVIKINSSLARTLGLDPDWLASSEGLGLLSGNDLPEGSDPLSMVYAGHQFGGWAPRLGDGRAILLGELVGKDGVRRDLQLKGSGQTPYSRQGDGKAPLGPVLREYLVSEAMAALGVPTTRALAALSTGEVLRRDGPVPGAILARVASSHVRVGTFQYFRSVGETDSLRQLADYVIERHYPEVLETEHPYRGLLEAVTRRNAALIARWMQLGFVHGVMNTDNMQIAGETIDFGPCAFMEAFDPGTVFSSIDENGRYAYGNQPAIGQWNSARLGEALLPLLSDDESAAVEHTDAGLAVFSEEFNAQFLSGFKEKLGFSQPFLDPDPTSDFVSETLSTMAKQKVDFTLFFRQLTQVAEGDGADALVSLFEDAAAGAKWLATWREVLEAPAPDAHSIEAMRRVNPIFIPRNHRVEEAIRAGMEGDFRPFERMNAVWSKPFEEQPAHSDLELSASIDERVRETFCGT
jgi:uncharacterized protein YdiU (UPF0061 family)